MRHRATFLIHTVSACLVLGCGGRATMQLPSPTLSAKVTGVESVAYALSTDPCSSGQIVISGTRCASVGIEAEHRWLATHYPGYTVLHQALLTSVVGSPCNTVSSSFSLDLPSGEKAGVTFDISEFYGRYEGCP